MLIHIPFGSENDKGQWWDGKCWRNQIASMFELVCRTENWSAYNHCGAHHDGVFKCPRCRRPHFIPDNFDYLCDGCANYVRDHQPEYAPQINEWRAKARVGQYKDPDVNARYVERNRLFLERHLTQL